MPTAKSRKIRKLWWGRVIGQCHFVNTVTQDRDSLEHPVLLQASVDRPSRDAERRCGRLLVVLVKGQGPQDQLLLDVGELRDGAAGDGDRRRVAGGKARQVGECDLLPRAHGEGALYEILELAHVAGKIVGLERYERLGRDAADLPAEAAAKAADEVVHEGRGVLAARAGRGAGHAHPAVAGGEGPGQTAPRGPPG